MSNNNGVKVFTRQTPIETREEARRQLVIVDKALADTITEMKDIEERVAELRVAIRESKPAIEMRALLKRKRDLTPTLYEGIGMRKLVFRLLKKWGIEPQETKLTRLAAKDEDVREMVHA